MGKSDIDEFREYLRSIGVEGEKISDTAIKVAGKNFDQIDIVKQGGYVGGGGSEPYLAIIYTVNRHVSPSPQRFLKRPLTETKKKKEGLLRKKVIGFEWEPKESPISQRLNQDMHLNSYLLSQFQAGMSDIEIWPVEKLPFVRIFLSIKGENPLSMDVIKDCWRNLYQYTTPKDIDAFDTIAKHIREM